MTYLALKKQLKKKQIPSVSLLYGVESYFIQDLQKLFINMVTKDKENLSIYDLQETPIQDVIADVETYPFFGEKKLVIARNPVFLQAKNKKLPFEHDVSILENYIQSPVDYSILLFIAPYEKIDQRKKVSKLFKKHAVVTECNPVKPYEAEKWVTQLADNLRVEIHPDAMEMIDTDIVTNLQLLESELKKLALFVGDKGVITKEVVEKLISPTPTSSSLRLVDAVIERDLYKAISIYKDLEQLKEDQIGLIGLLAFQFRMILRVKLLKQKGYGEAQIRKNIGAHPYVIKIAYTREKQFSTEKLKFIMDRLAKTDTVIKSGKMDKNIAFELLLYDLIRAS